MEMLFILVVIAAFFVLPVVFLLLTVAGLAYSIFRALGGGKRRAARPVGSEALVAQPRKVGSSQGSRLV
jgi:hypothetical protein